MTRRAVSIGRRLLLVAPVVLVGCVLPRLGGAPGFAEPFHLSSVVEEGDARQRASTRLVLDGLDADAALRPAAALPLYERALQLDPTNPWVYLALARHHADGSEPQTARSVLDQAQALLRSRGEVAPGVAAHLYGLRGIVLRADGRDEEALALLRRARELSPSAWSDARLEAWELR